MELKIGIKEVGEERRPLTNEENCFLEVMNFPRVLSHLSSYQEEAEGLLHLPSYQEVAEGLLHERGFIKYEISEKGREGLFRKETIRDATPEEIIAWYCIQSHIVCLTTDVATCRACPKNRGSNQCKMLEDYFESKKILKDKEIILELV